MKQLPEHFLSEEIMKKVNAKIEQELEILNRDIEEHKEEEKIGVFNWIMLIVLISIVFMKLGVILYSFF